MYYDDATTRTRTKQRAVTPGDYGVSNNITETQRQKSIRRVPINQATGKKSQAPTSKNIGIKRDFPFINIRKVPRDVSSAQGHNRLKAHKIPFICVGGNNLICFMYGNLQNDAVTTSHKSVSSV